MPTADIARIQQQSGRAADKGHTKRRFREAPGCIATFDFALKSAGPLFVELKWSQQVRCRKAGTASSRRGRLCIEVAKPPNLAGEASNPLFLSVADGSGGG